MDLKGAVSRSGLNGLQTLERERENEGERDRERGRGRECGYDGDVSRDQGQAEEWLQRG